MQCQATASSASHMSTQPFPGSHGLEWVVDVGGDVFAVYCHHKPLPLGRWRRRGDVFSCAECCTLKQCRLRRRLFFVVL